MCRQLWDLCLIRVGNFFETLGAKCQNVLGRVPKSFLSAQSISDELLAHMRQEFVIGMERQKIASNSLSGASRAPTFGLSNMPLRHDPGVSPAVCLRASDARFAVLARKRIIPKTTRL